MSMHDKEYIAAIENCMTKLTIIASEAERRKDKYEQKQALISYAYLCGVLKSTKTKHENKNNKGKWKMDTATLINILSLLAYTFLFLAFSTLVVKNVITGETFRAAFYTFLATLMLLGMLIDASILFKIISPK